MAILRIPRNIRKFSYGEGNETSIFGLRPTTVEEQKKIVGFLTAFTRSQKAELTNDTKDQIADSSIQLGDPDIMVEAMSYVTRWLVVDPDTGENVFSDNENDDKHEHISKVPSDFLNAAWNCFTGNNGTPFKAIAVQGLFDLDFMRENAQVPYKTVTDYCTMLEMTGQFDKAYKIRIALDLPRSKKPSEDQGEKNPTMTAVGTTT